MQIVIDIPEEIYNSACATNNIWNMRMAGFVCSAIANGMPLPKGHGRLIDADKLKEQATEIKLENLSKNIRVITRYKLEHAPTIIEADKESEE